MGPATCSWWGKGLVGATEGFFIRGAVKKSSKAKESPALQRFPDRRELQNCALSILPLTQDRKVLSPELSGALYELEAA